MKKSNPSHKVSHPSTSSEHSNHNSLDELNKILVSVRCTDNQVSLICSQLSTSISQYLHKEISDFQFGHSLCSLSNRLRLVSTQAHNSHLLVSRLFYNGSEQDSSGCLDARSL